MALLLIVGAAITCLLVFLGMAIASTWDIGRWLQCRLKPKRRYLLMATIVVDATKPIDIKNPVVRTAKDAEGSPIAIEPLTVQNFVVTVQNTVGNFGAVADNGDGSWTFDPGNEIDEQASGELAFTGEVVIDGETKPVEGLLSVELRPGEAVAFGAIEPELTVR